MANKNTRKPVQKPTKEMTPEEKKAAKAVRKAETKERTAKQQKVNQSRKKEKRHWGEYFRGVKTEIKKVVWPTKHELGEYTVVVLCACGFFALMFWAVDTGFLAALKAMLGINL